MAPTEEEPQFIPSSGEDQSNNQSGQQASSSLRIPSIVCRTIPGAANAQNRGAVDWGPHGQVAYGCNYTVVVVDPTSVQVVQALDRHKAMVTQVLWGRCPSPIGPTVSLHPPLASADATGHIIIWDVLKGEPSVVLHDGNKPVLDIHWVTGVDEDRHFLAALHPPYALVVWDTDSGSKLWKKTYTETLLGMDMDPFQPSRLAFLCQECILLVEDFTLAKVPSSNGRKFHVFSPPRPNLLSGAEGDATGSGEKDKEKDKGSSSSSRKRPGFGRLVRELVAGETRPRADSSYSSPLAHRECLQLGFHRLLPHHLLLLFPSELLLLDLDIFQTVGIVPLEKVSAPLFQVISCRQRDVLYCLHESGNIGVKFRRRSGPGSIPPTPLGSEGGSMSWESLPEVSYEQRCQSDALRLTKNTKVLGLSCDPVSEMRLALYLSNGRLVFLDLLVGSPYSSLYSLPSPALSDFPGAPTLPPFPCDALGDMLPPSTLSLICSQEVPSPSPSLTFPTPVKLLQTGLLPSLGAPPLILRMCPPLTTHNWQAYVPRLAVGTPSGAVQLLDMETGMVEKELSVHTYPVRGIEWTGLTSFLSHGYSNVSGQGVLVRNELVLTNIQTGKSLTLRTEKGDESLIDLIRVSPLKQYFIVAFKEDPFELWDLKSLTLLRTMPKKSPIITALEWSPSLSLKSQRRKTEENIIVQRDSGRPEWKDLTSTASATVAVKEHFVFTDIDGQLYHFTVEGSVIRDGFKILSEGSPSSVTWVAYRGELIVRGDTDGNLHVWDVKLRSSRSLSSGGRSGCVHKMRFAPGRGNFKLLVILGEAVEIWDLKEFQRISQLKCPKDMVKVVDGDWVASDKPVLATQDGCLRIVDLSLSTTCSPYHDYHRKEPTLCPSLLSPLASFHLRALLSRGDPFEVGQTLSREDREKVEEQLELLGPELTHLLDQKSLSTAHRSLLASRLYGHLADVEFWTVALHYLQAAKEGSLNEIELMGPEELIPGLKTSVKSSVVPLELGYDILCDAQTYKRYQMERVTLHESKRLSYDQTQRVVRQLILLRETELAVQLLLETELEHPNYYADGLRACLVAAARASGAAQSTVKLVATNLIANGRIWEGVQLLCLIDKGLDAARYLQSYGYWDDAAWLAKATLPAGEVAEVMRRWADHLTATGLKTKAVLVLVSQGLFERALELMASMTCRLRTALFLHSCLEFGVIKRSPATEPLVRVINLDYARLLFEARLLPGALAICDELGETGAQLKKEFEILAPELQTEPSSS